MDVMEECDIVGNRKNLLITLGGPSEFDIWLPSERIVYCKGKFLLNITIPQRSKLVKPKCLNFVLTAALIAGFFSVPSPAATTATAAGAQKVVERINGKLNDWNDAGNLEGLRVSVSIGIADWHEGDTLDEMLDGADRRMYEQKNS